MGKPPAIPHQVIVDFILSGKTTADAKEHFGFASDNVANLRVWAAFHALGIKRPRFQEHRICEFCGEGYLAVRRTLRSCGKPDCQQALILRWQKDDPAKVKKALAEYRGTEKGRLNNLRMHVKRRTRRHGSNAEKWNWAADEIKKSIRKLKYLFIRNAWEYRIQHIQKTGAVEANIQPKEKEEFTQHSRRTQWPSINSLAGRRQNSSNYRQSISLEAL